MKLITKDTAYAVRALACVAGSGKDIVTVKELAVRLKIPRPFLRKILQTLNKKGILESHKGRGGGFSLAVTPEEIHLLDLIEIFQGSFQVSEHSFRHKSCPNVNTCALKKKLDGLEDMMIRELGKISIRSLLETRI